MGEQVQAQVGVRDVLGRRVEVDLGAHDLQPHTPAVVLARQRREVVRRGRGVRDAEVRVGVPRVENGSGLVNGRQAETPGRAQAVSGRVVVLHAPTLPRRAVMVATIHRSDW